MSTHLVNRQQEEIVNAPLDVPLKVIAGAGTGKTETLTRRFIHLVDDCQLAPENILAITFTEKAASEMKTRIVGALARTGHLGGRRLSISTFHGFAGSLLREFVEQSGVAPDAPILSDVQQKLVLKRIFTDALAGRLDEDGLRAEDLAALDIPSLDSIPNLIKMVISRAKGNRWTPERFDAIALEREEAFYGALPDAAEAGRHTSKAGDLTTAIWQRMREAGFPCRAAEAVCVTNVDNDVRKVYYEALNRNKPEVIQGLAEALASQRAASALALTTLTALFREYNDRLARMDALDFDDIILRAVRMLEHCPEVAEACRRRYAYILVDEFQDTSPAQMDLIRAVSRSRDCPAECTEPCARRKDGRPVNITIVGDKKQAIYGFRNARRDNLDVLLPCQTSDVLKPLSTNYRSARAILALANTIGRRVEPDDERLGEHRDLDGLVHVPPVFHRGAARVNRGDEAAFISERIQNLVDPEGPTRASYRDIGVLIRGNRQFAALRKAFRTRHIPYVCAGAAGLFDEPAAKDALAWLRAAAHPSDDASLSRILARSSDPVSDADLMAARFEPSGNGAKPVVRPMALAVQPDAEDARFADAGARLREARSLARCLGLGDFIEDLPRVAGLNEAWSRDDREIWPQVRAALRQAAEEVERLTPAATLDDLLDLVDIYQSEEASWPGTPPEETDAVRVMTVHAAKGLEFPYVFVPSIKNSKSHDSGWIWDDEWGLLPAFNSGPSIKTTIARWLRTKKEEQEDEEDRCWYVAATRARNELVVTATAAANTKEDALARNLPEDVAQDVGCIPEDWAARVTVRCIEQAVAAPPAVAPSRPRRGILSASYSALSTFRRCPVEAWIERVWSLPSFLVEGNGGTGARRKGDLLHLCAARYFRGQKDHLPDAVFAADDGADVRRDVTRMWSGFLASECADWKPVDIERPVHLHLETPTGLVEVNGYADIVLPAEEGLVIADMKTSSTGAARDPAEYAPQLCLYRMAMREEGNAIGETGFVVLVDPDGTRVEHVRIDRYEDRLREDLYAYAAAFSTGRMPDRQAEPPCRECRFTDICPRCSTRELRTAEDPV